MGPRGGCDLKAPHGLASKSCLVPRTSMTVPLAQPPLAAMSHSLLKATIDMDLTPPGWLRKGDRSVRRPGTFVLRRVPADRTGSGKCGASHT